MTFVHVCKFAEIYYYAYSIRYGICKLICFYLKVFITYSTLLFSSFSHCRSIFIHHLALALYWESYQDLVYEVKMLFLEIIQSCLCSLQLKPHGKMILFILRTLNLALLKLLCCPCHICSQLKISLRHFDQKLENHQVHGPTFKLFQMTYDW